MERIDKVLSNLGILSRSECRKAASKGLISVNDIPCFKSDLKIDPDIDIIKYNGKTIQSGSYVYYMLNKPAGYVTANEDSLNPTVMDLINDTRKSLSAVGRLDKDTTGILIITNDGATNHHLVSPRHHVAKKYEVNIDGILDKSAITMLETGIDIGDDTLTLPAQLEIPDVTAPSKVNITITEGRYHQVKRMFAAVGCPVLSLHRSEFGPLKLDPSLLPGQYRPLTAEEIELIRYTP